eukprot:GGOE01011799.1.p4 GENE.GGOE01011799.1~~GGOE01011799.1.p4  ORF type:complete len:134 (-),score=1.83 GGOE01011799.1:972-1373(-)
MLVLHFWVLYFSVDTKARVCAHTAPHRPVRCSDDRISHTCAPPIVSHTVVCGPFCTTPHPDQQRFCVKQNAKWTLFVTQPFKISAEASFRFPPFGSAPAGVRLGGALRHMAVRNALPSCRLPPPPLPSLHRLA